MKQLIKNNKILDNYLLNIIVCPSCKKTLKINSDHTGLFCEASGLIYPIINGIPILIKEKAKKL
tara:strand:- start:458 stop:649 length:192 start_codon:yes stop_codon:yes gene_type:complete